MSTKAGETQVQLRHRQALMMSPKQGIDYFRYQPLKGLVIAPDENVAIELDPDYRLSNDMNMANQMAEDFLKPVLSRHFVADATMTKTFAFDLKTGPDATIEQEVIRGAMYDFGARGQKLLVGLWLIRDNSINPGITYLALDSSKGPGLVFDPTHLVYLMATQHVEFTSYTPDEIKKAFKLSLDVMALVPNRATDDVPVSSLTHGNRFSRAISFSQAARTNPDLAMKVAFYCMAFEALVSTDVAGVAHQVSERVALLIGENTAEQQAIYETMKRLYLLRSKTVHGAVVSFKADDADLPRIQSGDDYLRRALRKILETPDLAMLFSTAKEESVTGYFLGRIFRS